MNKATIVVDAVSKFGVRVGQEWYNIDGKSGLKVEQFEKGKTYTVLFNQSASGKKYMKQIVGEADKIISGPPIVVDGPSTAVVVKPGDDKLLDVLRQPNTHISGKKETDWDGIARGKVACAAYCAALASPGLAMYATNRQEYFDLVSNAAEEVIRNTWKHQKGE